MNVDLSLSRQAVSFLLFCGVGAGAGIIYDIYRSFLKLHFKGTYFPAGDIVVSILLSGFVFVSFLKISSLRLCWYCFFALAAGWSVYFLAVSSIFLRFFYNFFKIFEKILKILLQPVKFLCIILFRLSRYLFNLLLIPFRLTCVFLKRQAAETGKLFARMKKI